jgi:hypothetical protein
MGTPSSNFILACHTHTPPTMPPKRRQSSLSPASRARLPTRNHKEETPSHKPAPTNSPTPPRAKLPPSPAPHALSGKIPSALTGWTEPLAVAGVLSSCGFVAQGWRLQFDVVGPLSPFGEATLALVPVVALSYSLFDFESKNIRSTCVSACAVA